MPIRALAVAAAAFALAGCAQSTTGGGSDFSGQEQDVADVIDDLSKDASGTKAADICDDVLTADLRSKVAAGDRDCAEELEKALKDADAYDFDVTDVTITGDTAKATVEQTPRKDETVKRTFTLSRQGGGWRISSFG